MAEELQPIMGEMEITGVRDGTIRRSDGGSLNVKDHRHNFKQQRLNRNRLSIVTIVLSLTIRSHRIFPMHISNAKLNRSLWGKIWEGGGLLI